MSQITGDFADIVMIFDSDDNRINATDNGSSLPKVFRHPNGNNVLFVDGHVELQSKPKFEFSIGPRPTPYPTRTPVPRATERK